MTISSKDGLIAQEHFFNKLVSSKDLSGYYLLKKGEFAYNKSYSVGYDFGSIKRLELYEKGALSTLYICFSVKYFRPEYIRYYFDSLKWYKEIYLIAAEGARNHGLLNVPTESFFETKHLLSTNLMEQAKIANFLSLIDKRIEKQRQLVESLKKYKRGLLFSIFTSIQTSVKLEQISTYHSSNLTLEASQTKGNFALYDANGICSNIDTYMHDTDYVAIIKDGSGVGKLQYCKQKSSHIGTLGSLTSQSCSPYYLYTALQIIDFTKYITGMAIPHIYYKDYKKCDIPYPDRNSQNLIENTFKSIDKIITKSILNLEKLKLLKAGLLQQMFI